MLADADVSMFVTRLRAHARSRECALTARQLRDRWGYTDRQLRALVQQAAERGHLVVADNHGYFVPVSEAEIREAVGRLRSQAIEMLARARQVEQLATMAFAMPVSDRLF